MKLWVCQLTWSLCVSPDTYIPHRVEKLYLPSGKGLSIKAKYSVVVVITVCYW